MYLSGLPAYDTKSPTARLENVTASDATTPDATELPAGTPVFGTPATVRGYTVTVVPFGNTSGRRNVKEAMSRSVPLLADSPASTRFALATTAV
jgi:hypothetical protein